MAPGKKTRLSQKKKVIAAKISDPELSLRDIEKQTWINHQTVSDIIDEIPKVLTSSDNGLLENMKKMVSDISEITVNTVNKIKEKDVSVKDAKTLNEISEINWKRIQVMEWKPTEISQTKVKLDDLTPKQLEELKNQYL
jgi:predicted DNA-binding protein YlxM (UPF0122 family)